MTLETLLAKNAEWAKTWKNPFDMGERHAAAVKSGITSRRTIDASEDPATMILTCLDPRCVPEQYFSPGLGVIRNAGGRATQDVINTVTAIRTLVGVGTLIVVHHTDCGMTHLTPSTIRTTSTTRTPNATDAIDAVDPASWGCFEAAGFEDAIREDVRILRAAKVLGGVDVRGVALDLETGRAREVEGI